MIRLWTLGRIAVVDDRDEAIDAVATQTKRLGLLLYLALAEPRGWQRRDTLLALFWPELDTRRGRHALRQTLHFLRRHLGPDAVLTRGAEDVAAGPSLWCDAVAFQEAGASAADAVALYRGDLLPGFFVRAAAAEFDHWLDLRRDSLRTRAAALAKEGRVTVARPPAGPAIEVPAPARTHAPTTSRRRTWWRFRFPAAALLVLASAASLARWVRPPAAQAQHALADSLYTEGLRTLKGRADGRAALGWFEAALRTDPHFALAAFYAGASVATYDGPGASSWYARADRLAANASERDRLFIRASIAFGRDLPVTLDIADSLAARYPSDADVQHLAGTARLWHGDFARALTSFRRELALAGTGPSALAHCGPCDALNAIATTLQFADSFDAARRVAREAIRIAPHSSGAWGQLATIQSGLGHYREAASALRRADELVPGQPTNLFGAAGLAIEAGDFPAVDRILASTIAVGTEGDRKSALWFLVISLRNQGRLDDALAAARAYRRLGPDTLVPHLEAIPQAQVLFEQGRYRESALLFDSIARIPRLFARSNPGGGARAQCWAWTHVGEALAASGDTIRVLALADSIDRIAASSLYGRDHHLAPHLRGLVLLARGRIDSAAATLRRAVFSPTMGYSRTNLALARVLLGQGRPAEAAGLLRAALEGPIDGSSYYATGTELRELLARTYDVAGVRDSAIVQYRAVVRAWSNADPAFSVRVAFARRRLAELSAFLGHPDAD